MSRHPARVPVVPALPTAPGGDAGTAPGTSPTRAPGRRRTSRAGRPARAAAVALALLVAAGCGVRLETPPPTEPVPDAVEVVRRAAVADALHVAELADAASADPASSPEAVAELTAVGTQARAHAEALGGVYESGIETDEPDASPTTSPSAVTATPADVVAALTDAAGRSAASADVTADGPLARLVASVGTAQTVSAVRLAPLAGVEAPAVAEAHVPAPDTSGPAGTAASPTPGATSATTSPTTAATLDPDAAAARVPEGLSAADLATLVVAEDAAGYAMEVRAAQSEGGQRDALVARAAQHRQRAQDWAVLAGTEGTDQDPRRAAYTVADAQTPALVQQLETGLAADYATLVGTTAAGTRTSLARLLTDAWSAALAGGAAPVAFPGLPEQTA